MTDQAVVVNLPSSTYEQLRENAERSNRSVEDMLSGMAALFFAPLPELDNALAVMQDYTDEELWRVIAMRLHAQDEQRMDALTAKSKQTTLSDDEEAEFDTLLERLEQFILIRSEALMQLKLRGYDMDSYLNLSA